MSMDTCKHCGASVDTDDEPEAYSVVDEDGNEVVTESCRCESCRDKINDAPFICEHAPDNRASIEP